MHVLNAATLENTHYRIIRFLFHRYLCRKGLASRLATIEKRTYRLLRRIQLYFSSLQQKERQSKVSRRVERARSITVCISRRQRESIRVFTDSVFRREPRLVQFENILDTEQFALSIFVSLDGRKVSGLQASLVGDAHLLLLVELPRVYELLQGTSPE